MNPSPSSSVRRDASTDPCSQSQQPCADAAPSSSCCSREASCRASSGARGSHVRTGLALEYLTIGWEAIEASVALAAALHANSVALLGFGVDSIAELVSASVLIWRLKTQQRGYPSAHIEKIDGRARRLVGISLLVLSLYIAFDAVRTLALAAKPAPSVAGMALTTFAMFLMLWLGRAKRRTAADLGSGALSADAFQATACFWLCLITLAGLGFNLALGWWWADPIAALAIVFFIVREGFAAWRGEECSCC